MTKKEIKIIEDAIKELGDAYKYSELNHDEKIDVKARKECLEWLLYTLGTWKYED